MQHVRKPARVPTTVVTYIDPRTDNVLDQNIIQAATRGRLMALIEECAVRILRARRLKTVVGYTETGEQVAVCNTR